MADNDLEIKFGADASGAQAGAQQAKSAVTDLSKAIQDLAASTRQNTAAMSQGFRDLGDQIASSMRQAQSASSTASAGISNQMRGASEAMTQASHSSTGLRRELIVMAHEAATGRFSRLGGSVLVLAERWQALGAVLANPVTWGFAAVAAAAAGVVAVFVEGGAEAAKLNNTLALTGNYAGVTASQFQDMASKLGDQTTIGVGKARSVLEQLMATGRFTGAEIQQLGQDTVAFSQRSGESTDKVIADWVKLAEQPSKYAEEFASQYHGSISTAQLEHIRLLEEQGDKQGALAAAVQDLTQWINGQATAVDGITGRFQVWGKVIGDVADKFALLIHARQASNGEQLAQVNSEIAQAQQLGQTTEGRRGLVGTNGNFDAYLAGLERQKTLLEGVEAVDQAAAQAESNHNQTVATANGLLDAAHTKLLSLKSSAQQAAEGWQNLVDTMAKIKAANPNNADVKDFDANQDKYKAAFMHRADPGDNQKGADQVATWTEQLQQMETASSDFFNDETATELAFWQRKLSMVASGSKAWAEVQSKIYEDQKKLAHDAYDAQIAGDKDAIDAAKDNWGQQAAALDKYVSDVGAKYRADSAQFQEALRTRADAYREHLNQLRQEAVQAARDQEQTADTQAQDELAKQKEALGAQITAIEDAGKQGLASRQEVDSKVKALLDQQVADEKAAAEKILQARLGLDAATMAAYAAGTTENQKALNDKLVAEAAYEKAVSASQVSADKQYQTLLQSQSNQVISNFEKMATRIGDLWRTTTEGLIKGTETWQQAYYKILDGVLDAFLQMIERQVVKWITAEATKTGITSAQTAIRKAIELVTGTQAVAQTAATNIALVNSNAAVAGSGAAAAVAAIPLIGPELAVSEGAATYAEVLGMFGSMASAAGGWGQIPEDQIAQVHKDEMILPAKIASPLRSIISSYSAPSANLAAAAAAPLSQVSNAFGGGSQGAPPSLHVSAMDGKSVQRFFDQHADKMARSLQRATRNTMRAPARA